MFNDNIPSSLQHRNFYKIHSLEILIFWYINIKYNCLFRIKFIPTSSQEAAVGEPIV